MHSVYIVLVNTHHDMFARFDFSSNYSPGLLSETELEGGD